MKSHHLAVAALLAALAVPAQAELLARKDLSMETALTIAAVTGVLWTLGTAVIGGVDLWLSNGDAARRSTLTIGLGGLTTCAFAYLLAERAARPMLAVALAAHPRRRMWSARQTPAS